MATPFTAFRKYTGAFMAVLCVLLMISFVVADALPGMGRGDAGASRAGERVATWRGGSMNERQLAEAVRHRAILAAFQERVFTLGARDAEAAGVGDLGLRVRPLPLPDSRQEGVERDVVRTKIFAERAREAGMVVSDELVQDYLSALGRDRVGPDQMRALIQNMRVGSSNATISFMFDLLREAILAKNYLTSHAYLFETVLPAEAWEDYLLVNDRVILEAAPLRAEDYLAAVPEPSDDELAEFFEEHRDFEPAPERLAEYGNVELPSPQPAFTRPEKVTIEYVVAWFDAVADRLATEVTDEEIRAYYDANRERFIETDASLFGTDSLFDDEDDDATDGTPADPEGSEPEGPGLGGTTPSDEAAEPAADDTEAQSTDASEEGAPADLEAVIEEEEEEEAADSAADETPAEETPTGDDSLAENLAVQEPADQADASADAEASGPQDSTVYQPLDEVSDEIRLAIAQGRAAEVMNQQMGELKTRLYEAFEEYDDAVLEAEEVDREPPEAPAELTDLGPIAEEYGYERGTLGPIGLIDLRDNTVGRSVEADPTAAQTLPLWITAFREGAAQEYEPLITYDLDGNRYLLVIAKRQARDTPELSEVRDDVVRAWKLQKAADLALADAEKQAAAVAEAGQPLAGYFVDNAAVEPVETEPFSFLTIGSVSRETGRVTLALSQPETLTAAGPELMKAAFDLGVGEVGAALNHDRTIAYVLRIAGRLATTDELREDFLREGANWYGLPSTRSARVRRAANALVDDLLEDADLEWEREPDGVPGA